MENVKGSSGPGRLPRVLMLLVGALAAVAAWVFLVRAAISFGLAARDGQGMTGWLFTAGATMGAIACLLLVFTLAARLWSMVGSRDRTGAAPPRGGRHRS